MNWIKESGTLIISPGSRYQIWTEWKESETLIILPGSRYQKWTEWKESGTLITHLNNHKPYQLDTKYINKDSTKIIRKSSITYLKTLIFNWKYKKKYIPEILIKNWEFPDENYFDKKKF